MINVLLLLKPDRLEAYPTCLGSVDHAQTDRAHREGRIDDCRVMIVEMEEVGRVVYSVLVFYLTNHHSPLQNSHFLAVVRAQRPYYGEIHYRLLGCSISGPGCCRGLLKWRTKAMLKD